MPMPNRSNKVKAIARPLIVIVGLSLCAIPAAAQSFRPQVEPTVKAVRAQYPPLLNAEQVGDMLNAIAWQHRPNIKLLKKGGGGKCPSPIGVTISCDILIWAPPGTPDAQTVHVDVLSGASGDGLVSASPMWKSAGACTKRADSGCEMKNAIAPVAPSGPVDPEEGEPDVPPSSDLEQRVRALEDRINRHLKE